MELQCREMAEAFVESFNGRLRDECLNSLLDLGGARRKIRAWAKDDNEQRPHRSLGHLTPIDQESRLMPTLVRSLLLLFSGHGAPSRWRTLLSALNSLPSNENENDPY